MARRMFETRSQSWRDAGLARQISTRAAQRARRARVEAAVLVPLFVAVLLAYNYRQQLLGVDVPVRIGAVLVLLVLGWAIARDVGRAMGPVLFRRLDPATAGTVGFLIRLATIVVALLVALRIAGLDPRTLAAGGAITAVVLGLAAQQTLGNLFAGTVLLSARPFRVGERVRLQGGGIAGRIEGVVSSLGLLYTTFASGEDSIMVPNSVVLNLAVTPLREPDGVDLRARLRPGMTPRDLQALLQESITTPLRDDPRITLEEVDGDEVVVRISATPSVASDGPQLASELLEVVSRETRSASGNGREEKD
ncbi:MAG TPA: mechanosensitive ion channel family protein [Solirubrobacteraceae bacterium]|nr:mechanosensitive ion channel family protein [Solirubrobacteraceae bacterium]